jgi:uncharacterized protein YndB with AHSA1/START domain
MSPRSSAPRAVADLSEGTILAVVEIAAPPERVFRALTDPGEITRWWGSETTYRTTHHEADLKVGGRWKSTGRGADGTAFNVGGKFLEIDAPRKLVMTWVADWDGGNPTQVTYRLEPVEGGTRLTVRHEGFAGRPESCAGHADGWELVLSWLKEDAAPARAAAPEPRFFLCRLIPPRKSFALDMTPAERAVMEEHTRYWSGKLAEGTALLFGPVLDPAGGWGVGVIRVNDDVQLQTLQREDPAIRSGIGFRYEALPMPQVIFPTLDS